MKRIFHKIAIALPLITTLIIVTYSEITYASDATRQCRAQVVADFRENGLSRDALRQRLRDCRNAGVKSQASEQRLRCRTEAFQQSNKNRNAYRMLYRECLQQAPTPLNDEAQLQNLLGFSLSEKGVIFGDILLGQPISTEILLGPGQENGSRDCTALQRASEDSNQWEYLLFGNHPKAFRHWQNVSNQALQQWARQGRRDTEEQYRFSEIRGVGRIYRGATDGTPLLLFPSAPCRINVTEKRALTREVFFTPQPGMRHFTPLFGVSFFGDSGGVSSASEVLAELRTLFGDNFRVRHEKPGMLFVANAEFRQFDEERDPRDLCLEPRPHDVVAVVKLAASDLKNIEYLLVADIKSLCRHGDLISHRVSIRD